MDEVAKQKDTLVNEVASLRAELQQVSEDRDSLLLQVQTLTAEVVNCEELVEKSNELKVCFKIWFDFLCIYFTIIFPYMLNLCTGKMFIPE